ncbi:Hypothetical protein HVR_LOCUS88 [uncultured virus]|nr:Hypothetical protein HVR_LOCUS88 [uncultured virus]
MLKLCKEMGEWMTTEDTNKNIYKLLEFVAAYGGINMENFHITARKFLEIIFDLIDPTKTGQLTKEWWIQREGDRNKNITVLTEWVNYNFLPPLSNEIIEVINGENVPGFLYNDHVGRELIIKRGIIIYIDKMAKLNKIVDITPWDIKDFLDFEGQSLIKNIKFPTQTISVIFTMGEEPVPYIHNIYDISLDQFMGMILGIRFAMVDTKVNRSITIFETTVDDKSFDNRLTSYISANEAKPQTRYTLEIPYYGIYKFDNLEFLQGFITPFSWVGDTPDSEFFKFKQWDDPQYPQGKEFIL